MDGPRTELLFNAAYAQRQIGRRQNPLRRWVKAFYLDNVLRHADGPTLDFGCGAGQLLERLPAGSMGVEVNSGLLTDLRTRGLDVRFYDALADDFQFSPFPAGRFKTLVMSHVLEHFDDAALVLAHVLRGCRRLGIERVVVVVPGRRGYASDSTHRTFVSPAYLRQGGFKYLEGYTLAREHFFPINLEKAGDWFIYNEYTAVFQYAP